MEELLKSLIYIQQNLNAPKDQYNSFGKYNYRSLEGILAAIKPLLLDEGCGIRFEDEIVEHSGRTFLKTTLILFNSQGHSITSTALAEHAETKSGMDAAQITGAASSYARKYAMNALFAIDDTQDADTDTYHTRQQKKTYNKKTTQKPTDRQANIKAALAGATTMEALNHLYTSHKVVVDSDASIRELFTQRKNQLKSA